VPSTQTLNATFAALADPTRRAILERLTTGEATVLELAAPFRVSLPAISRHLKVLERAGLITRARDAQTRPCRLRTARLDDVTRWADHTRQAWESRFDRLGAHLREMQAEERKTTSRTKKRPMEK
jgi:DNA-binding transcriptional ArsR family regulator